VKQLKFESTSAPFFLHCRSYSAVKICSKTVKSYNT